MNSKGKQYVRIKRHDAIVLTFIEGTPEYEQFKQLHLQTLDQMSHLDKPAFIKGLRIVGAPGVVTVFVTLTAMRSMTQFHFELGMEEILGRGTETVNGDRDKWVLWRLRMAHEFAFKIQDVANKKAFLEGEWETSTIGDTVAFDPERDWHRGRQPLTCSKTPEIFGVYQLALPCLANYYLEKLNITGGFGQYAWTEEIYLQQMKELQRNVVDMEKAIRSGPEKQFCIQELSNVFQSTFRVPLGILVRSDPRWMATTPTGFWEYGNMEREQWCMSMQHDEFDEWQRMVAPLYMPEPNRKPKEFTIAETGVRRVCEYILTNPGRIFAVSTSSSQWHHPSCSTFERRGYGGEIQFRDLMGTFNPSSPEVRAMWMSLVSASTCCGALWVASILHYADGELKEPPTLRLMTVNKRSRVCVNIEAQVYVDEEDNVAQARTTVNVLKSEDPWVRYAHIIREVAVSKRLYHGDVFQPRLFNDLAASLGILEKRRLYEPKPKGLLFGSLELEEKED